MKFVPYVQFLEFDEWLSQCQKDTKSNYYISNRYPNGKVTYLCNKSGHYKPRGKGNRQIAEGTRKQVKFCPSSVKLSPVDGKFQIEYISSHIGHDEGDFKNIRLSEECKLSVISQITKGVKEREIIKHAREEYDFNQREH